MKPASPTDLEAIGLALAGFTFWVLADSSIKLVGKSKLPAYEILAFLGLFIALLVLLRGLWRRDVRAVWPLRPRRQLLRSCLDLANNFCVVIALRHLTLSLFYILVFMSPMVITLLAGLFLREPIHMRRVIAIVGGFIGVIVAVNPFGSSRQGDWVGYLACAICVICFSANMTWSRIITQSETPESLTFFSGALMAVTGFGCMLWRAQPISLRMTAILVAMGLFCALGSICFFIALKHTSAANVSQYHYTQLITGSLVGYLIWREKPTIFMVIGGIVIVLSGIYIALAVSKERPEEAPRFPFVPYEQ